MKVTWQQFEYYNPDTTSAFENLCRLLFKRKFFNKEIILHSNHNNPGVEVEPVFCSKIRKNISFQAKYFEKLNYYQIKHSVEKTVEYYAQKIDALYLYCNKDISTNSQAYKEIKNILHSNNIELVLITNQEILDDVQLDPILISGYFGRSSLSRNWFEDRLRDSIESLGSRHNEFNVPTSEEDFLDLFTQSSKSIDYINTKIINAVDEIKRHKSKVPKYTVLLNRISEKISNIKKVNYANVCECLQWKDIIYNEFKDEFKKIEVAVSKKEKLLSTVNREEKSSKYEEIQNLNWILDIPYKLSLTKYEENLLVKKCLIIKGDAGTGKTQLLSNKAEELINDRKFAVLLLGQNFISSVTLSNQILSYLEFDGSIDDLLNSFECLGEENNCMISIFIDALNESTDRAIWKRGLNSFLNKIEKYNHLKLAVTVRTGYESFVFDDSINEKLAKDNIPRLIHHGFLENTIDKIRAFLDYYHIPFSPSYSLSYEMTNPMFLKLFCETYDGEKLDMFSLFEKLIKNVDKELKEVFKIESDFNLLINLLNEIIEYQLTYGTRIPADDLLNLPFWNTYGLNDKKVQYISTASRTTILNNFAKEDTEYYYLGYNLLEDFLTAKLIFNKFTDKDTLIDYIKNDLLKIVNDDISNYDSIGAFVVLCSLIYKQYKEEVVELFLSFIKDDSTRSRIIESYIDSFQWRTEDSINSKNFLGFINKYNVERDCVFDVLFQNAVKINNPLNADFLHDILLNKSLSYRDYVWTTYINNYLGDDSRIFQLIELFEKGNTFDDFDKESIRLILVLFSWLLTSSNRFLRDKTSKAIIEILKNNFDLCLVILRKFEEVNDPYVIQRLYGIVFGACTKRAYLCKNDYKLLVEYVYNTIFNKDLVYPDILLRDYAKLIIERYIYEFSTDELNIDINKIYPPYKSIEIPIVKKEEYYAEKDYGSGFNRIDMSMKPACKSHMYGDFGRYIFESALNEFYNVDVENIYHYALQYIRDEMGYDDKLFSEYDCNLYNFGYRNETKKIERIGKKYQWIAMYNILARISDKHLLDNYNDDAQPYQGTWEPYVRDFDPTINLHFLKSDKIPTFNFKDFDVELLFINSDNDDEIRKWAATEIEFFSEHKNDLLLKDNYGNEWILLHQYQKIVNKKYEETRGRSILSNGNQDIWKMSRGYFVDRSIFEEFKLSLQNTNFLGRWFPEIRETYQLFNREYAWSNGYNSIFQDSQLQVEVNNGEFETVKSFDFQPVFDSDKIILESFEVECEVPIKKYIGEVTQSFLMYLWECQYDASQDDATTLYVPCKKIIDCFNLKQKEYDGYYYDEDTLVVYDGSNSGIDSGLLIRKDYLMRFLEKSNMKLFWTCLGEKQYFRGDRNQIWSEWSGFLYLNNDGNIKGSMKFQKIK